MITDFQCNTVCFSALLQGLAPVTYANMISVLDRYGIGYRLLPHTNDVWCRDYMPVQVADGVFRGFTYNPDYLQVSEELLAKAIEEHFNAELIVLPWDKCEFYGHADGLVRYTGNDHVLLTNYDRFNKGFMSKVVKVLQQHFCVFRRNVGQVVR